MGESPQRWLLLLGSSLPGPERLHAALAALGEAGWLTGVQRFAADDASPRQFYNALAQWHVAGDADTVRSRIRDIEAALGRDRDNRHEVAIDIDLLAHWADGQWQVWPHAQAKGEFSRPLVQGLLREAGVVVRGATPPSLAAPQSSRRGGCDG